jgi:hypothetical protein
VTDRSEYVRGPGRPALRVVGHEERTPPFDREVAKRGVAACRAALERAKQKDESDPT